METKKKEKEKTKENRNRSVDTDSNLMAAKKEGSGEKLRRIEIMVANTLSIGDSLNSAHVSTHLSMCVCLLGLPQQSTTK